MFAHEESNDIRETVVDTTPQYFWYGAIALMLAGTLAIFGEFTPLV